MLDFDRFETVFGPLNPFPFDRAWAQQVESNRQTLDGQLFLDRVLAALNLSKAAASYPPKNEQALRQLHQQVCQAPNVAVHHKLSIIYYLLLALDDRLLSTSFASNASKSSKRSQRAAVPGRADDFAAWAPMPQSYHVFMKGLWHMDSRQFPQALRHLTHPSLQVPEFADDIVSVLARDSDSSELALAYYHAVRPVFRSNESLELLFNVLSRADVGEALRFARARPAATREQLFQLLVHSVLDSQDSDRPEEMAQRAFELTSLPLDADEERWFTDYLNSSAGKRLPGAKDTILMRRIANGNSGPVSEKGTWAVVLEGFKAGSGGRAV